MTFGGEALYLCLPLTSSQPSASFTFLFFDTLILFCLTTSLEFLVDKTLLDFEIRLFEVFFTFLALEEFVSLIKFLLITGTDDLGSVFLVSTDSLLLIERSGVETTALLRAVVVCETPFATTKAAVFELVLIFLMVAVCEAVIVVVVGVECIRDLKLRANGL
jgi:hypothetical protein